MNLLIGQKSRGDCLNHCVKQKTFNKCFNFYSVVTKDLVTKKDEMICSKTNSNYLKYATARRECMSLCKITCIEEGIEVWLHFSCYILVDNLDTFR